jgi:hypothetical protein
MPDSRTAHDNAIDNALDDLRNYADGESVPADEARAVVAGELERLRQRVATLEAHLRPALDGRPRHQMVEAADYFDEVGHSIARWEWACSYGAVDRGTWPLEGLSAQTSWWHHATGEIDGR